MSSDTLKTYTIGGMEFAARSRAAANLAYRIKMGNRRAQVPNKQAEAPRLARNQPYHNNEGC